jgi:hypothetical protein
MRSTPKTLLTAAAFAICALVMSACAEPEATTVPLDNLVLQDSLYHDAETMQPYSGLVVKSFPGEEAEIQIEGEMAGGMWNGEIVVYHENGRIRYMGSLNNGEKCGEWIENRDSDPPGDVLAELKQEIESLGIYPACPDR